MEKYQEATKKVYAKYAKDWAPYDDVIKLPNQKPLLIVRLSIL
jgi:hypothetical protein